ncbi:MAG: methyltransferase domain-containing protein [Deltaproteobacteria bacterium]|nr:methyltransferase domain-containing protein [Deltaproteobacteria bacterium]
MTDKQSIRISFSKAASTYDGNSDVQREVALEVSALISGIIRNGCFAVAPRGKSVFSGEGLRVLDIGCGTGRLVGFLRSELPDASFTGSDIALPMVYKAIENNKDIQGVTADCDELPFTGSSFDIICSSLTYQWSTDLLSAFKEVKRVLKTGGIFTFSTLGPDTLYELRASYAQACTKSAPPSPIVFQGVDNLLMNLKNAGLHIIGVEKRIIKKRYDSLFALLKTLKNIGAAPPVKTEKNGLAIGSILRKAQEAYSREFPWPEGGITATYEVIYVTACKI